MRMTLPSAAFIFMFIGLCDSKTKEEWKSRIIYQLLTDRFASDDPNIQPCTDLRSYCGGTFKGIEEKLDYITGLGANAIWISPIIENTPKGYHGYWAKNIYEINQNFGTEDDFKYLISECHKRDVWVMVDIVANHMGYNDGCFWNVDCSQSQLSNFTGFTPFNASDHYHNLCEINNFRNQTEVELCRLAKLPDLNQSNHYVRSTLLKWITDLTDKYDIDGYRIDTAVEVQKDFWAEFQQAAGAFCIGEANNGDNMTYLSEYQGPLDSVLNFPLFDSITRVFTENASMVHLKTTVEKERLLYLDVTLLGNFVDNHDFPRFLHLAPETSLLMNALTFVILGQGIPIIYYGTEQGFNGRYDPENRESLWPHYNRSTTLYQFIASLSLFRRRSAIDFSSDVQDILFADANYFLFSRGTSVKSHEVLIFLTNRIPPGNETKVFDVSGIADKTEYENINDKKDRITVVNGSVQVNFYRGLPKVYQFIDHRGERPSSGSRQVQMDLVLYIVATIITVFVVVVYF